MENRISESGVSSLYKVLKLNSSLTELIVEQSTANGSRPKLIPMDKRVCVKPSDQQETGILSHFRPDYNPNTGEIQNIPPLILKQMTLR